MRAFAYVAFTDAGKRRSGTVVAETEAHAADILRERGLFVSDVNARREDTAQHAVLRRARHRLNSDLQAVFTRQMAVLLSADLPMEAALEAVRVSGTSSAMEAVASRAKAALMDGQPLSNALDASGAGFAPYYIAAVRAGEVSGDVDVVFSELANHLESAGTDKAQISTALIYPTFVAVVSLLVCGILMTTVAPEIVAMFEISDRPLPELTRVVLGVSDWVQANSVLLMAIGVGVLVLGVLSGRVTVLRNLRDRIVLRLPVFGRLKRVAASVQYLRTLALVLSSRQAVLNAVSSASGVLTVAQFQREATLVGEGILSGQSLSTALRELSIIPPVARQLIDAGEASARLAGMTERAAVLVENGLSTERKRIAALLEPALMMLVGGMVLVIVLAVLLPIFDLQQVVAG